MIMSKTRSNKKVTFRFLYLLAALLLVSQSQCIRGEDDPLSIPLMPYTGDQLRIDGYYYQIGYDGETIFDAYFFYKNGMLIYCGGGGESSLEEMDTYIKRYYIDIKQNGYKYAKQRVGVFLVEGNDIKFSRWYPSEKPYSAFVSEGMILNDTTFHITKSYRSTGTQEPRARDEMYFFRKFSPKHDSTNRFIP